MPFKSEAQRRYFHVLQAQGKMSPETVKEWEDATSPKVKKRLPYHVGDAKKTGAELEKLAAAVRGKLVAKADASARQYSLREDPSGKMSCTCGDYKFRQGAVGGECKHIKAHKSSSGARAPAEMLRDHVKAGSEAALAKYALEYRGKTFPGYNKPIKSDQPDKKKMVLAKSGDTVKLIHFGHSGYKHNYSEAAKKNYLQRSAGITDKDGKLTKDNRLSANYWARRVLWPNGPADGSSKG